MHEDRSEPAHPLERLRLALSGGLEGENRDPAPSAAPARWANHLRVVGIVIACTLLSGLLYPHIDPTNLIMVYLLGVMGAALWLGRGPSVLASVLSVAAFDFFFVPPRFTLAVSDTQYLVTFAVMLVAALSLSTMANWLRLETTASRRRERRTAALYRLSRELGASRPSDQLLQTAARIVGEEADAEVTVLLPAAEGRVVVAAWERTAAPLGGREIEAAERAFHQGVPAGLGTSMVADAHGVYLPLAGTGGVIGVLRLVPRQGAGGLRPDVLRFLEAMASQATLAVERGRLAEQAEHTRVQVESERLKNTVLSSVSHDFRTPLAAITGAATSLLDGSVRQESVRRELLETIAEESQRLGRQVSDLLDMTRLESGRLVACKEWHLLEEVVGAALERLEPALAGRDVRVDVGTVSFVPLDDVLIGQVLTNLIENAVKYTPPGTPIEICAENEPGAVRVEVADRGPGLPPGDEEIVFEKFHRGADGAWQRGVGLGLAICRGLVQAHGGRIEGHNRHGGGAVFRFWLPVEGGPPSLEPAASEEAAGTGG